MFITVISSIYSHKLDISATIVQFVASPRVFTLNLILSPLTIEYKDPVVISYIDADNVNVPIDVAENDPTSDDFSIVIEDVAETPVVCTLKLILFTDHDMGVDPSTGSYGIGTSATSGPIDVGVNAEQRTTDLPTGTYDAVLA